MSDSLVLHSFKLIEQIPQGDDQQAGRDVSCGVQGVKWQTCGDPRHRLRGGVSKEDRLSGGIERTVSQPVQTADDRIYGDGDLARHMPRQEHGDAPQ